jgi:periplasmic copper chaperone A
MEKVMKKSTFITLLFSSALFLSSFANAHDYKAGDLQIDHPWSKAVPPNSSVAAAFFNVTNHGNENDVLISAESPIAGKVELHAHIHEDGMMKMREVKNIEIPANDGTALKPGANHIMFFNLTKVPKLGDRFPLTLHFKNAGEITIEVAVEKATYQMEMKPEKTQEQHH